MRSDNAKKGAERAPHRSLLKASGYTDWEIARPWVGVVNPYNALIPGHIHLNRIAEAVKSAVYAFGGFPLEFPVIGVCDGIAMNHEGMKFSLPSRELIMDSIELMARAHALDARGGYAWLWPGRLHPARGEHPDHAGRAGPCV